MSEQLKIITKCTTVLMFTLLLTTAGTRVYVHVFVKIYYRCNLLYYTLVWPNTVNLNVYT